MIDRATKSLAWRWALVSVITGLLSLLSWRGLHLEQDVVGSIEKSRPREAAIFNQMQGGGLFQNRVFIRLNQPDQGLAAQLEAALAGAGYELTTAFQTNLKSPRELYPLIPFLPAEVRREVLSAAHRRAVSAQVQGWLSLPGSMGMIKLLGSDPLLLALTLPRLLQAPGAQASAEAPPLVATRKAPMDYERTRELYRFLRQHDQQLAFASGDFFALENYDVVQSDMAVCSLLSVLVSLVVFRLLCRRWILLALLLFGTWVSSVTGLLAAEWIDGTIYGLVLALASTFLSFNNETLVHLAGHEPGHGHGKSLVAVCSALGTTVIGFLVLLFSSSHMARQMAIISLGSMLGFLLFLGLFSASLRTLKFRSLSLPQWAWPRWLLATTFIIACGLLAALPRPSFKTNLDDFRYASDYLEAETKVFAKAFSGLALEDLRAIPLKPNEDPAVAYQRLPEAKPPRFHPLAWFVPEAQQQAALAATTAELQQSLAAMELELRQLGLNLRIAPDLGQLKVLNSRAYLQLWQLIVPVPWYVPASVPTDGAHLLAFVPPGVAVEGAIPLHPKAFYEFILDELTVNIGLLFLLGLAVMLVYLIPWQRDWAKIALIFLPLMIAALGLQLFFWATGRSLTIVHVMGLTLVIGVALDYSAILVSTDHDPVDQGKVVLTGGLTLTSFGSLLFATHPVLKELALVVVIGTLVAFVMALFTRLPATTQAPAAGEVV